MKSLSVVTRLLRAARIAHVVRNATRPALFAACLAGAALPAHAQTTLADQPLFAAANVPFAASTTGCVITVDGGNPAAFPR